MQYGNGTFTLLRSDTRLIHTYEHHLALAFALDLATNTSLVRAVFSLGRRRRGCRLLSTAWFRETAANTGRIRTLNEQEAHLPQRNSASAAHLYLGWLTDRALH